MKSIQEWLDAYGESHQNPINKKIHWVCVPLIFASIVGLLWSIPRPLEYVWANYAVFLLVLSLGYYLMISRSLALGMLLVSGASIGVVIEFESLCTSMGSSLWKGSLLVFIIAWIGQFIGHKIEGKKPSFFEDLQFLMIGPLWLLAFIYRRFGLKY